MSISGDAAAPRGRPQRSLGRAAVRRVVEQDPGVHFMEVVRRGGLSQGTVQHHLRALVEAGEVVVVRTSGHTCFFPAPGPDADMAALHAAVRAQTTRRLLGLLAAEPRTLTALAAAAGLPVSSVHYHVQKLVQARGVAVQRLPGRRRLVLTALGRAFVRLDVP